MIIGPWGLGRQRVFARGTQSSLPSLSLFRIRHQEDRGGKKFILSNQDPLLTPANGSSDELNHNPDYIFFCLLYFSLFWIDNQNVNLVEYFCFFKNSID